MRYETSSFAGASSAARVFYLIASCGRALTSDFNGYAQAYAGPLGPAEIAKAGQYPTMASVLGAVQEIRKTWGFPATSLHLVRVEETPGISQPAKETRKIISENEVCSAKGGVVKWAVRYNNSGFAGFVSGAKNHIGHRTVADANLANSIAEASGFIADRLKASTAFGYPGDCPCDFTIVPVLVTTTPATTAVSTFKTTVLS